MQGKHEKPKNKSKILWRDSMEWFGWLTKGLCEITFLDFVVFFFEVIFLAVVTLFILIVASNFIDTKTN